MSMLLLASCLASSRTTPFWTDEILTYYPMTDPSFGHMLDACRDIINTVPPLFFILGWGWVKVFGASEFALRSFSCLAFCGAFWVMWGIIRRRYGSFAAASGLVAAFLSQHILSQNDQARFYGLYLLTSALAVFQYARLMETNIRFGWKSYALNFLTHAGMVFTHTFGFLYSGCILITALLLCGRDRRRQTLFFVSVVLAWAMFCLVWGKSFFHHMHAFQYSWIPVPSIGRLISTIFWCRAVELVALFGLTSLAMSWTVVREQAADAGGATAFDYVRERVLPLLGVSMVVLPASLAWIVSRVWTSCFLERYLLPSALGWAMILAFMLYHVRLRFEHWRSDWNPRINLLWRWGMPFIIFLISMSFLVAVPSSLSTHVRQSIDGLVGRKQKLPRPDDFVDNIMSATGISPELPIVCPFVHRYNQLFFYSVKPSRYFFLLDWDYAMSDKEKAGVFVTEYLLMDALKRNYPEQNIFPWQTFVNTHNSFLVLEENRSRWSNFRLLTNRDLLANEVFQDKAMGIHLWLISRRTKE